MPKYPVTFLWVLAFSSFPRMGHLPRCFPQEHWVLFIQENNLCSVPSSRARQWEAGNTAECLTRYGWAQGARASPRSTWHPAGEDSSNEHECRVWLAPVEWSSLLGSAAVVPQAQQNKEWWHCSLLAQSNDSFMQHSWCYSQHVGRETCSVWVTALGSPVFVETRDLNSVPAFAPGLLCKSPAHAGLQHPGTVPGITFVLPLSTHCKVI